MKVRILVGATAAYACITTDHVSLDVRLEPGRSAAQALREWATEQREKSARLSRDAMFANEAAYLLEAQAAEAEEY